MSLDYRFQPLEVWPAEETARRQRSPFKTIWTKVLAHLERELRQLGARNLVIRLQVAPRDIRQDGQLRADARPPKPGVIIQFTAGRLKGEPSLLYRCDQYAFWQDNVSAIARTLEALRAVKRYGATPTEEQYAGFKALPASTSTTLSTENAADIIAEHSSVGRQAILRDPVAGQNAIRIARQRTHPDRNAGQSDLWNAVERARAVLHNHWGLQTA
jgi:hypothetical protein